MLCLSDVESKGKQGRALGAHLERSTNPEHLHHTHQRPKKKEDLRKIPRRSALRIEGTREKQEGHMAGRFVKEAKNLWRRVFNLYARPSPYDDAPPKSKEMRYPSPAYVTWWCCLCCLCIRDFVCDMDMVQ